MESLYDLSKHLLQGKSSDMHQSSKLDDIGSIEEKNDLFSVHTQLNYLTLSKYLHDQGVRHVAMQYPLLPVRILQSMLTKSPWVTYIGNEYNFQQALSSHEYSDIFTDNFGGIFGHTTLFGHQLIASAAADTIQHVVSVQNTLQ